MELEHKMYSYLGSFPESISMLQPTWFMTQDDDHVKDEDVVGGFAPIGVHGGFASLSKPAKICELRVSGQLHQLDGVRETLDKAHVGGIGGALAFAFLVFSLPLINLNNIGRPTVANEQWDDSVFVIDPHL